MIAEILPEKIVGSSLSIAMIVSIDVDVGPTIVDEIVNWPDPSKEILIVGSLEGAVVTADKLIPATVLVPAG